MHVPADSAAQPAVGGGTMLRQLDTFGHTARASKRQKVWISTGQADRLFCWSDARPSSIKACDCVTSDRETALCVAPLTVWSGKCMSVSSASKGALIRATAGAGRNERGHKTVRALRPDQDRALLLAGQHDLRRSAPSLPHVRRRQAAAHGPTCRGGAARGGATLAHRASAGPGTGISDGEHAQAKAQPRLQSPCLRTTACSCFYTTISSDRSKPHCHQCSQHCQVWQQRPALQHVYVAHEQRLA